MRKLLKYSFIIFILSIKIYSQNYSVEYSDSIPKKWKYFELNQIEKAIVVDHTLIQVLCGAMTFASVTIVKNNKGEIFRVLDLCNSKKFAPNEDVLLSPEKTPSFNVYFPKKYVVSTNGNKVIQESNYDETISQTTWASIEKNTH
ncbi:hypothetical protein [Flavobacterium mesophilum]|uniref:hypothetical protein n=1 Tax=Flavobacterium mesophilum TaxID=3143495 RepID=UPI0031DF8B9C